MPDPEARKPCVGLCVHLRSEKAMPLEPIDPIVEKICEYFDGVFTLQHTVPEDRIEVAKILALYIKDHASMEAIRQSQPNDLIRLFNKDSQGMWWCYWSGVNVQAANLTDAILEAAKAKKGGA